MEILSVKTLVPAIVTYRDQGEDRAAFVYIDYLNKKIVTHGTLDDIPRELSEAILAKIFEDAQATTLVLDRPEVQFDRTPARSYTDLSEHLQTEGPHERSEQD